MRMRKYLVVTTGDPKLAGNLYSSVVEAGSLEQAVVKVLETRSTHTVVAVAEEFRREVGDLDLMFSALASVHVTEVRIGERIPASALR